MRASSKYRSHLKFALLVSLMIFIGYAFSISEANSASSNDGTTGPLMVAQAKKAKSSKKKTKTEKKKAKTEKKAAPSKKAASGKKAQPSKKTAEATKPLPGTGGAVPILDPTNPKSIIYLDTSGKLAGTGDPSKPASAAYRAGRGWHPQALSAAGLPKDKYGLVDWAKLVRENIIQPKASLDPKAEEMPPLKMDVIIPAKGDFTNDVLYPHEMHTYWLKCNVCHPKIFVPAKGQNKMSMVEIAQGKWCGRCHGKVAFPLTDCNRCHTVPKKKNEAKK